MVIGGKSFYCIIILGGVLMKNEEVKELVENDYFCNKNNIAYSAYLHTAN